MSVGPTAKLINRSRHDSDGLLVLPKIQSTSSAHRLTADRSKGYLAVALTLSSRHRSSATRGQMYPNHLNGKAS